MSQPTRTIDVPAETLPIIDEADVLVVGGGSSGFIAATAAALTGARTILVERFGYLGGCTTTTYNTSIGVFSDSNGDQIIRGLPWEYLLRMQADGQAYIDERGRNQIWPIWTKKVALDMVLEAGVELYLYTWASGVVRHEGRVEGLIVQTKGGRGVIRATTIVDASGDADVAAMAGAPFEMTPVEELQQVSCDYTACGVDAARVLEWARAHRDELRSVHGVDQDHQPAGPQPMLTFVIPSPTTDQGEHIGVMPTVKLCIYRQAVRLQGNVEIDPLDPRALTYAEVQGLRGAIEHLHYLQANVPGFEHAFLVAQNHLGVRETRRILGDYTIRIEDLHSQTRLDDVVALNCRGLDYHLKGTLFKISFFEGHHDIPLRALLPQGIDNVVVCGRSISCDHLAQASLRGAATCMATGHAAGTAAALAARHGGRLRDLDVHQLQRALLDQDAILAAGERTQTPREGK